MPSIDTFSILTLLVVGAVTTWLGYNKWKAVKDPEAVANVSGRVAMLLLAGLTGAIAGAALWVFTATQNQQAINVPRHSPISAPAPPPVSWQLQRRSSPRATSANRIERARNRCGAL